eukprot:c9167_g1_i1.p1 GENE.c9167_g1_i1~~c9167_g1_i1.p1  ORF type:complete len:338 (-),score=92.58 c9167_g1_i1:68-1081(-)
MFAGLCGTSRPRSDEQQKSLPNLSNIFESADELAEKLQLKQQEIEKLQQELKAIDSDKEWLYMSQQQLEDVMEAQQAELSRLRMRVPSESLTKEWLGKVAVEAERLQDLTAEQRTEETAVLELQRNVDELSSRAKEQQIDIDVIKEHMPEDDSEEQESASDFKANDGPSGFVSRLKAMKGGEMMSIWQDNKFQPVFVSLVSGYREVAFASGAGKKPYETIPVNEIASITYPARPVEKKKKSGAKEYMMFSIESPSQSFTLWASTQAQLVTWCVGLQNLSARPGQALVDKGTFMWRRTQSKIHAEAEVRGVSTQQLIADAIRQMLPDDDHGVEAEQSE